MAGMVENLKERLQATWREFADSKPGHRFQDRYRRRQEQGGSGHIIKRVFLIVLGSVLAVGSLFTAPLPGPGFATVFLGLAILAGELLPAARFLDWAELRLRAFWQFVRDVWHTGLLGKVVIVAVVAVLVAAFAYVIYFVLFRR